MTTKDTITILGCTINANIFAATGDSLADDAAMLDKLRRQWDAAIRGAA